MAFYMVINKIITHHQFDYLDDITGRRLEPTLAPTQRREVKADQSPDTWVPELMTKEVITLSPSDTVKDALKIFQEKQIHHIPLAISNQLVGMVSDRDIMWLKMLELDQEAHLEQFMSNIVVVCDEETALDHLAHVFYREGINGIPVMNEKHHLVGIVTHRDILRWIYDK